MLNVRAVVEKYLDDANARHKAGLFSIHSLRACRRDLGRFADSFGPQSIEACRNADLSDFILGPQWADATRSRVLAEVLACFRWARDEGVIDHCPYHRPKRLRLRPRQRREARADEYVSLMRGASRPIRRALFFLRRTGCRPDEMRAVQFANVIWQDGIVLLYQHKAFRSTGKPRMFGLDRPTLRFLRNLQRQAKDKNGPIFLNCKGRRWNANTLAKNLRLTLKRLGLDSGNGQRVTAYCFRHSWTSQAIELGIGERQVADQLGHASTALIGWYSKAKTKAPYLRAVAEQATRRSR